MSNVPIKLAITQQWQNTEILCCCVHILEWFYLFFFSPVYLRGDTNCKCGFPWNVHKLHTPMVSTQIQTQNVPDKTPWWACMASGLNAWSQEVLPGMFCVWIWAENMGVCSFWKKETGNTLLLPDNLLIYLSNNTILYRRLRVVKITKTEIGTKRWRKADVASSSTRKPTLTKGGSKLRWPGKAMLLLRDHSPAGSSPEGVHAPQLQDLIASKNDRNADILPYKYQKYIYIFLRNFSCKSLKLEVRWQFFLEGRGCLGEDTRCLVLIQVQFLCSQDLLLNILYLE